VIYSLNDQQTYSNCTITVTNVSNEVSNVLNLGTFFVDVPVGPNPPVLTEITPVPNPSTVTTPSYTFHSTQGGTISYGGACGNGNVANAVAGNNSVIYSLNDQQTYSDCTISVTNVSNETSNTLYLGTFFIDVPVGPNPPVLLEVTPIPNPSTVTTPSYVFNSTQPGTITYGGSCANGDIANAIAGNNTVVYSLTDGQTYNDCTISVTNASNEVSNVLNLGTFLVDVPVGPNPPVLVEVTAIPDPSSTITPSYVFNSTQAGTMTYGGSCGNGDVANAIAGNNTVIYSLTDGQTYNDCTITVTNVSNEVSNVLTLGAFTVTVTPTPNPNPPVVSSGGGGSGKAGMRFSGQRRDDYARSGKFWDMSKSIADVERINQGYLGRVTTYINRNGFRVFAGYLPGRLSLDYLSSRIQRSHKFVYRGERASRSGNQRRATKRQWETHPQTYFRNRWAHNAFFGIDKAVAFDPKEDAMKVQGGNTWTRPQWRRGGVWARDHVSINSNANPNKVVTPLPVYLPRLSINVKKQLPTSLGVRRVNLQYTVAKGVSRMRPVRIESAASNAYEMYVTDFKEPWANDRFFNRRETLEMYPGDGTSGQRTIRIERTLNPAYGAIIETSQEAWERSFLTPEKAPQNSFGRVNPEFIREDSYTNRVPTINDKTGRRYDTEVERWRAYRIQKSERINQWEVRPYSQYQEERGVDRTNG
jgi:formaldehyde-activating enzyme involved in methanogenesis